MSPIITCTSTAIQASAETFLEELTDLSALQNRRALVLLDQQNLSIGAQQLGYGLDYRLLGKRLRSNAAAVDLHLFIAVERRSRWVVRRYQRQGYVVHTKTARHVPLPNGRWRHDCNIDNLFAFWAGLFVVPVAREVVVLGSGDYGLAGEIAQAIANVTAGGRPEVMTLSLPGSTARDLKAGRNPHIAANLEIGRDVLRPQCA